MSEIFRIHTIANNDGNKAPIMTLGSTSFFHVRHMNLYLVCATKTNVNAALVFEFLYRVITIGRSYFGKLDEEAVKNNFVLIYELLDGGFPSKQALRMGADASGTIRDTGLWLPAELRDRHAQDVHHH